MNLLQNLTQETCASLLYNSTGFLYNFLSVCQRYNREFYLHA